MHVYLNPDDLVLIARFMGFHNTKSLFDNSIVILDYERNGAPVPRLRFSAGVNGCCPFLENRLDERGNGYKLKGLCRLHPDSKPLVCALAPLFRRVDLVSGSEEWGFKEPLPGCPGCGEDQDLPAAERPGELESRLESERSFFKRLAALLDEKAGEEKIIKSLYYLDIK